MSLRYITANLRHRIAAEIHHFLTMPDYYYVKTGTVVHANDEVRVAANECWHKVRRSGFTALYPMIRRPKHAD